MAKRNYTKALAYAERAAALEEKENREMLRELAATAKKVVRPGKRLVMGATIARKQSPRPYAKAVL